MKLIRLVALMIFCTVFFAGVANAQKEIFIKQIDFKLDYISDIDYENEYFLTLKLSKASNYLFKITNHLEGYAGEAVLELLDADNLILTNNLSDKYFNKVSFQCKKTGFYDLLIKYKDGKLGNSIIDVLMIQ